MATNTHKVSSDPRAGKQPSYQYDPWDQDAGKYSSSLSNGEGYDGDIQQPDNYSKATQQQSATNSLRNAENSALSKQERTYNDNTNNGSLYTGTGRSKNDQSKQKTKGKGKLRNKSALITLLMLLFGGGVFLSSSHSLLAPAISTLFTGTGQVNYAPYSLRSRYITSYMLKHNSGGAVTSSRFTGRLKYTKIPTRLKNRLATYNIDVEGSGSNTRLSWTHTTSTGGTETISGIDADTFVKMYNDNPEFRDTYTKARYGRAALFYDKVADKVYKKLGISRNLQRNYVQTGNADVDAENYNNTLKPKFEGDSTNLASRSDYEWEEEVTVKKEDGTTATELVPKKDSAPTNSSSSTSTTTEVEAQAKATGMIGDIASRVGRVGSSICTTLKVGSMIGMAASAMEKYQSIQYFYAQMESISKMKAGYGDESGVNTLLNDLTSPQTTEVQDFSPTLFDFSFLTNFDPNAKVDAENDYTTMPSGESAKKMTTETGAAVQASGFQSLLSGAPIDSNSAQNYSLERIFLAIGGSALFGAGTMKTCAGVSLMNSIVSIGIMLSPAGLVSIAGNFLTGIIQSAIITVSMTAFFSFLVPTLGNIFYRNVIDYAIGIPMGQIMARSAITALMDAAIRGSAMMPSGKQQSQTFGRVYNEVLAMEAEQERTRLSPFDTSSPNTFFGSIAYSLLPTITSPNTTGLAAFVRSASTSLASLVGKVSADGEGSSYMTTYGNCPLLEEIGAVGDIYCNPIATSDMSEEMINLDPDDTTYTSVLMDASATNNDTANLTCDDEGNCEINKDSNLAKFISYCDGRDSPYGVVDQNILTELGYAPSGVLGTALGIVPGLGEVIDGATAANQLFTDSVDWANGSRCGNTDQNSEFWNTEGKYYQVYVNDQRILDQMGAYDDSVNPVLAYEEAYEAEHPVDDSYIGYISRISGLTPENTETTLAFMSYYTYISDYDPTLRLAVEDMVIKLNAEEVVAEAEAEQLLFEDNSQVNNPLETNVASRQYIMYADIRNRSYAA